MSNVVNLSPPPPPPEELECKEFPELNLLRELTILINTHRGGTIVDNFAAALRRILKEERP
jgi:hypothetical protein